jgi:small subunit ribosomal protein S20
LANNKSSEKRIHVNEKKRLRNKPLRTTARTAVKKAETVVAAGDAETSLEAVKAAISNLDRVASKGVIHPNNAARRKSRLMAKYNQLLSAQG